MASETAKIFFHGPEEFNCAQAVFKTFQKQFNISDQTIAEHKKNGGGRVEGGTCGALFAAHELLPEHKEEITKRFVNEATYHTCDEIKYTSEYPCRECVGLAAQIVQDLSK